MITTQSWRKRVLSSAVALVAVSGLTACGSDYTTDEARAYAVERMQARFESMTGQETYRSVSELLPNTQFSIDGAPAKPLADAVVKGRITSVEDGKAHVWPPDGPDKRQEVSFDDSRAMARTLHLTIQPEERIGEGAPILDPITVGLAISGSTDTDKMKEGLLSLGTVVVFLGKGSNVLNYDLSIYRVVGNGQLVARVDRDGRLTMPFMDPDHARHIMGSVATVDDLRKTAANPGRVIRVEKKNGVLVRV